MWLYSLCSHIFEDYVLYTCVCYFAVDDMIFLCSMISKQLV